MSFSVNRSAKKQFAQKNSTRMEINMSRIAVITDSNSGINFEDAKRTWD